MGGWCVWGVCVCVGVCVWGGGAGAGGPGAGRHPVGHRGMRRGASPRYLAVAAVAEPAGYEGREVGKGEGRGAVRRVESAVGSCREGLTAPAGGRGG